MRQYLTTKKVYSVSGNARDFLNGLTSNDLVSINNAFLTIHGRIIATFDQLQISEDQFLLCFEESYVSVVLEHLDKYAKLSGSKIEETNYRAYFDLANAYSLEEGDHAIPQKAGKLVLTERELESNVSEDEFTLFRVQNNIPVQGLDYTDEMLLNVSVVEFVSFEKGCFLGQEPISKVYNRSKPTWRLVVKLEDDILDDDKPMTSKIKDPDTDKVLGFVFEKNGD